MKRSSKKKPPNPATAAATNEKLKRNIGNYRTHFIEYSKRNGSTWMIRLIKSFKLL
jgi:hypothetical protein